MKLKIGIIGATGFIGSPYRKEIRESGDDAEIVALCARRLDLLEAAGKEDNAALVTQNWREVVEHPEVNFVIVATPDALHHEAVLACANAGKHLLCEKPVALNAGQAHEMWAAYRSKKLATYVPFWTRYVPVFSRANEIVKAGTLGDIKAIIYRWHNPRPASMPFTWRDDASLSAAGSIADVGSHAYDTVRWILCQEATRVLAHGDAITPAKPDLGEVNLGEAIEWGQSHSQAESKTNRKGTTFDYANIAWEFESGAVGALTVSHATYLRKGLAPELELHGTEASLAVDRIRSELVIGRPDREAEVLERLTDPGFGNRFFKHVFPAIRQQLAGETCEHPTLEDGWRVQLFTDAAVQSVATGSWVEVGR